MARKWSNQNLPGALHFVTGNLLDRIPVFKQDVCCRVFLRTCGDLMDEWPSKMIAYVLMPDHFHLVVNPRDGRITQLVGALKSLSARRIVEAAHEINFRREEPDDDGSTHQVWQEGFKAVPLWSAWMTGKRLTTFMQIR